MPIPLMIPPEEELEEKEEEDRLEFGARRIDRVRESDCMAY
jgi:hypothetical protein